jgi:hypothetical protein
MKKAELEKKEKLELKRGYDICECGHYRKIHNDKIGWCWKNANLHFNYKMEVIGKDCNCQKFKLRKKQ